MPKIKLSCPVCSQPFERFPSVIQHAKNRGATALFCSRECTGKARSDGLIAAKRQNGKSFDCECCGKNFYRPKSMIDAGKSRFCSEPCRIKGYKLGLIDRTGERPNRLLGEEISCQFCGDIVYRKKSMIERNIDKTCGKVECVSAYGRSLWGLEPRSPKDVAKPRPQRKARKENFTPAQRRRWISDKCKRCGATDNLTLDHILAVVNGGKSIKSNAQTLCGPCNNWKVKHIDKPLARQRTQLGG